MLRVLKQQRTKRSERPLGDVHAGAVAERAASEGMGWSLQREELWVRRGRLDGSSSARVPASVTLAVDVALLQTRDAQELAVSRSAGKRAIVSTSSTTTCRGQNFGIVGQEPVWTGVRGGGVKAVSPAPAGPERSDAP